MSGKVETKLYEVEGFAFRFTPNGSPFTGVLSATAAGLGTYSAETNLNKAGSRKNYATEAAELYGMDSAALKRALNDLALLRQEETAPESTDGGEEPQEATQPLSEDAAALVAAPGVLNRYVEDVSRIRGVVRDRGALKLQTLVAVGAQLEPLPNGKPAGANLILTAEAGRGKNYVCDAVASCLPENFYLAFESASGKSLYYRAEVEPEILQHKWIYPNEAEATDELVEMFRPLLSGGKASHLTVNKDAAGRNASQELSLTGPAAITIPTVRNKLDGQLQTRMLVAELQDYTGRVAEHSRAVSRQLLPDYAGEDHSPRIREWQAALKSLASVRRVIFPVDHEGFTFDSDTVSHGSRLWGNLLGLMLAHAWLEQNSREVRELPSGEHAVVATPEDYEAAYTIFRETCERSVINLSDTHRKILDAVHALREEANSSEFGTHYIADGFSQRKIAERARVHHSTVQEQRTFLTKSVKLLRETEGGALALVAEAEPSWWSKGEVLAGFPRPQQVADWYEESASGGESTSPESARQTRHPEDASHNAGTYAEKSGGYSNRHEADATRHPGTEEYSEEVAGGKPPVADGTAATQNRVDKPNTESTDPVAGVAGGSGSENTSPVHHTRQQQQRPLSDDVAPGKSATLSEVAERRGSVEGALTVREALSEINTSGTGAALNAANYRKGELGEESAIEYTTKAILRRRGRNAGGWQHHAPAVRAALTHDAFCDCAECS